MKRWTTFAGLALLVLGLSACSPAEPSLRRRVVSLVPAGTRALAKLEYSDWIVAADAESLRLLADPVPQTTLEEALTHQPDVVFIGSPTASDAESLEAIRLAGTSVFEVAPQSLIDALALYEEIAAQLGERARGRAVAHRLSDPIARVSTGQLGRARPCIAVLVDVESLVLAGGHSFESDLVEIAGGESVTHHEDAGRVPTDSTRLRDVAPDLVIAATGDPLPEVQRARVRARLAPLRVAFTTLDRDELWLGDPAPALEAWGLLVDSVRPETFTAQLPDGCRH